MAVKICIVDFWVMTPCSVVTTIFRVEVVREAGLGTASLVSAYCSSYLGQSACDVTYVNMYVLRYARLEEGQTVGWHKGVFMSRLLARNPQTPLSPLVTWKSAPEY
jgi:hypothetical protein